MVRHMQTNTRIINDSTTDERKRNQRDYYMKQTCTMPPTESLQFPCTLLWGLMLVCMFLLGFFLTILRKTTFQQGKSGKTKFFFLFSFF